ncbi:MAG TPA: hypothetical protein VMU10_03220 [Desulfomonilia bacterium]|nr:hypothetical protein [Desulfomonilia bacterium]
MQKVPIEIVKPGMVLARTVTSDAGMVLCGEGTELTDVIIERLKQKNVSHVTLKGHPVDFGDSKTTEQKIGELKERFLQVKGDPLMEKILEATERAIIALDAERAEESSEEGGQS